MPVVSLPTAQPFAPTVAYDGHTATVTWKPVSGATGYAINVLQDGATQPVGTATAQAADTSAQVTPTISDTTKQTLTRPADDLVAVGEAEVRGRKAKVLLWSLKDAPGPSSTAIEGKTVEA